MAGDDKRHPVGRHAIAHGACRSVKSGLCRQINVADCVAEGNPPTFREHAALEMAEGFKIDVDIGERVSTPGGISLKPFGQFRLVSDKFRSVDQFPVYPPLGSRSRSVSERELFDVFSAGDESHPSQVGGEYT